MRIVCMKEIHMTVESIINHDELCNSTIPMRSFKLLTRGFTSCLIVSVTSKATHETLM